jgi:hypothetical protein
MSGLAALLAGHDRPDIYQWHNVAHVDDIRHTVELADWKFVYLDGWLVQDKSSFMKAVGSAFAFPEPLGESFDALSDCLGDVTAGDHEGVLLLWDGWGPFAREDEQVFSVALSVLGGRVNADRGGKFAVLLHGDGPATDVPELPAKG